MKKSDEQESSDFQQSRPQEETQSNSRYHQNLIYPAHDYPLVDSSLLESENSNLVDNLFYVHSVLNGNAQCLDGLPENTATIADCSNTDFVTLLPENYGSCENTNSRIEDRFEYPHQRLHHQNVHLAGTSQSSPQNQQSFRNTNTQRKEEDVFRELISMARTKNSYQQVQNLSEIEALWQLQDDLHASSPNIQTISHGSPQKEIPSQVDREPTPSELSSPVEPSQTKYHLKIIQQPKRGRMAGYGSKDRRPISPPPILQLIVTTADGKLVDPETFNTSFLVAVCDLCSIDESENKSSEYSTASSASSNQLIRFQRADIVEQTTGNHSTIQMRNLTGSLATSATKLYDLDEGTYRLRFMLVNIESPDHHKVNETSKSAVMQAVETESFTVYSAKKFPGVVNTTPLSACFAHQGMKVTARKRKTAPGSVESVEDEHDGSS